MQLIVKIPFLTNVSFSIQSGSLTGIVGPNGAGKSTLIKILLQLHPTLSGKVSFFGTSLKKKRIKSRLCPATRFGRLGFSNLMPNEDVGDGRLCPAADQ